MFLKILEWLYLQQKGNLVYYDALTGAKTRHYYDRVAKQKFSEKEIMVAFVDVNNLKGVNDARGHMAGSHLLKQISNNLMNISGKYEVCRIGGDEFVLLGQFDLNELNRIQGVSVGSVTKECYEDLSSAVGKADKLMYQNKYNK